MHYLFTPTCDVFKIYSYSSLILSFLPPKSSGSVHFFTSARPHSSSQLPPAPLCRLLKGFLKGPASAPGDERDTLGRALCAAHGRVPEVAIKASADHLPVASGTPNQHIGVAVRDVLLYYISGSSFGMKSAGPNLGKCRSPD